MNRKAVSVILAAVMMTGMVPASVFAEENAAPSVGEINYNYDDLTDQEKEAVDAGLINLDGTLPLVTDPAAFEEKYGNISALIVNTADRVVEVGDLEMCKKWAEETGVVFDWQPIPQEGAQEKINLLLASGDTLPDVFWNFGDGKSGNIVCQYANQGIFVPTEDLINNYAPAVKAVLDNSENYWAEIIAPDGHTYGFPYIEEMYGLVLTGGPWLINKNWLDKVGKEVPTTVDEWVDCMKAFRDGGDLNGNGEEDEIPLATWFGATDTFGSYNMFYRFTGAFGCADSYCGGNQYADHLRLIDGKVTFTAMDEAFRKTAEFFNMLYNENLIWNGSFEADESAAYHKSLIKEDVARVGCFCTWTDQEITNLDVHDEYVPIPRLQGEAGMTGFENNYSELQDSSNTAITIDCEFPHLVAEFVNWMNSDPYMAVQSNWGAEGYNYVMDENGVLRTPLDEQGRYIAQHEEYGDFGTARVNSTTCRGSMIIQNEFYDTYAGYTYDAVQLLENQKVNGKDDIMAEYDTIPRVLMTNDELNRLTQIQPTVSDVVDRYINEWVINGVTDDSWDAYLNELTAAGVQDIVDIYQAAVDRVNA